MEDREIVQLYWERNERAITETSCKYEHYCTTIAVNILNNHEDAEECVNSTYLSAWNTMPPHKPTMLSTFLGKIVRNLSFNRYKQCHALKRGGYEIKLILDELSEIVSDEENVEDNVIRDELLKTINTFLESLSAEKKNIFIRRYWYSDSIAAIAKNYGRSENSVSVELSRIRKKLSNYLKKRGYDL
jgi:RNA polymerase sigma-70 factor (ECF subfamily)